MRNSISFRRSPLLLALAAVLSTLPARSEPASQLDQLIEAVIAGERDLARTLESYQPLVETYIQTVKPDTVLGTVPVEDSYFFGRLLLPPEPSEGEGRDRGEAKASKRKTLNLFDDFHSATFNPEEFARMLILDRGAFDREHYDFEFIRAEFLGEIRALIFNVIPKQGKALNPLRTGRFTGRIWVEDQDHRIVRFNGIYLSAMTVNFHFDSWRLNMAPGLWLPAYVYTEEPERAFKQLQLTHKGQTRIWGYEIERPDAADEFTKVLIDAPETSDRSDSPGQISPVASARVWETEAEDNLIRRLERAGLLAPEGELDEVLETVVANLEITNSLDIQPPVRCRVLLTTPLESFTIGKTIVLSRGLVDVLPDEASLAMVLAHELGHITSAHVLDTTYAFGDPRRFGRERKERPPFERDPAEELEADERAIALLANSPYKDGLGNAGLFLKSLAAKARYVPALIRPHFGSPMAGRDQLQRMARLAELAPELDPTSIDQTAALPLGGRVKLDPWSGRVQLMQNNRVPVLSAREKMPFQVTPLMPYLARVGPDGSGSRGAVASDRARAGSR